ncbi:MAG: ANTAR domain-containing protein [Acidimicrobiia bacterium]
MDDHPEHEGTGQRAETFGGAILDSEALEALLQRVVQLAHRTIDGAQAVSITVVEGKGYRTSNSTDEAAVAVDEAQYAGDDGPCLHGMRTARQAYVPMDTLAERWPMVAERAREFGIAGVLTTPLKVEEDRVIGALNVYAGDERAFGEEPMGTASALGEHAAILIDNAMALMGASYLNEQLRHAVASREIIGEAKGILMAREDCTRDEAFDILRRASQRENRKLRQLAEELVLRVEDRNRGRRGG